jgi:hypothetical protein
MNSVTTHFLLDAIERAAKDRLSSMIKLEENPQTSENNGVGTILREAIEQGHQDYDMIIGWLGRVRVPEA